MDDQLVDRNLDHTKRRVEENCRLPSPDITDVTIADPQCGMGLMCEGELY